MSRRVLIVSPNFPPINTPDHQRVRTSLPYFREFGWEPYVLALDPSVRDGSNDGNIDQLLGDTVPDDISVTRVKLPWVLGRKLFGEGSLSLRALPYLKRAGGRLIERERINLVYFSTTLFPVMALGPWWRRQFGVPYVLDFQDPWLSDYYSRPGAPTPPGGRVKYACSQMLARILEPCSIRRMSHAICVSCAYPKALIERYPGLQLDQFTVLPFGAPEKDFAYLSMLDIQQTIFNTGDGNRNWVYVGRGGNDLAKALRILFLAIQIRREQNPAEWTHIKLHFVGTNYAQRSRAVETVAPIAKEFGIADLVKEYPHRVPYFEALQILVDSDAILLVGSDDPGYTASKLYPCVLARKPILAVFNEQSSVASILRRCNAGRAVTFSSADEPASLLETMTEHLNWLLACPKDYSPETDWSEFQPYTARETTRAQCAIFDSQPSFLEAENTVDESL